MRRDANAITISLSWPKLRPSPPVMNNKCDEFPENGNAAMGVSRVTSISLFLFFSFFWIDFATYSSFDSRHDREDGIIVIRRIDAYVSAIFRRMEGHLCRLDLKILYKVSRLDNINFSTIQPLISVVEIDYFSFDRVCF